MRKIYPTSIFFSIVLCTSILQAQQSNTHRWGIGLSAVKAEYTGDLGNGILNFDQQVYGQLGLKVSRFLTPTFDLSIDGSYGQLGFIKSPQESFISDMLQANLSLVFKFANGAILSEEAALSPFLTAGVGVVNLSPAEGTAEQATNFIIPAGVGLTWKISEALGFFWHSNYAFTNSDMIDKTRGDSGNNNMLNGNDSYLLHHLGIKFSLGSYADTDGDGISDNNDACPNQSGSYTCAGCPDRDMDGIANMVDFCPDEPGGMAFNGCPDTDNDGFKDSEDECPTEKGTLKNKGCPENY